MTTFRTDDNSRWGSGKGSDLTAAEVDINFWDVISELAALSAHVAGSAVGIDYISLTPPDQMIIHLTDHTTQGPFTIPTASWNRRTDNHGEWAPSTLYIKNDIFGFNGALYLVMLTHTSGASFDPNATDGMGHDLYALLLTAPGNVLPLGGLTGQYLVKLSNADLDTGWTTSYTVPSGGTTGQVLVKHSNASGDSMWAEPGAPGPPTLLTLGGVFEFDNVFSPANQFLKFLDGTGTFHAQQVDFTDLSGTPTLEQTRFGSTTTLGTSGTVDIDLTLSDVYRVTPTGDITFTCSDTSIVCNIFMIFFTDGTNRTMTFGSGIISEGILNTGGIASKVIVVQFVCDGSSLYEVSRTTVMP